MRPRADIRSEAGFTLLETIAAIAILFVGMAGAMTVMERAAAAQASAKLREQAVLLQRELVEAARSVKYADLNPGTVVARLQALPALADASPAAGWQLRRRGVVYDVAVGACTVDDPRDSTGPHDTATYCQSGFGTTSEAVCRTALGTTGDIRGTGPASGAAIGDCGLDRNLDGEVDGLGGGASGAGTDVQPNDFKRIVVLVRWRLGSGSRYVLQNSVLPWPGAADGLTVQSIAVSPSGAGGAPPTAGPGTNQFALTATTSANAATVGWTIDGTPGNAAAMSGANRTWSFTWALGPVTARAAGAVPAANEVVDGTYLVSAKAFDQASIAGPERAEAVVVSRRAPFSVPEQVARNQDGVIEVAWTQLSERDITAYRLYRRSGTTTVQICEVLEATACRDTAPPAGMLYYWVVGVDATQEGDEPSSRLPAWGGAAAPTVPRNLAGTRSGTSVTLTWQAPSSGSVLGYRVYRDGIELGDLLGSTSGTSFVDDDAGSNPRDYYVSAVGTYGGESPFAGPVRR